MPVSNIKVITQKKTHFSLSIQVSLGFFSFLSAKRCFVLAVSFQNGFIYLLKSFDDVSPAHINTGINGALGMVMEWSNSRELLAVAGTTFHYSTAADVHESSAHILSSDIVYDNCLQFYTENGVLLHQTRIPNSMAPVSALTWGHNDKRLFIATGTQIHIAWVSRRIATLQLLCRLQIQASVGSEYLLPFLPLPTRIKLLISNLYAQTIRVSYIIFTYIIYYSDT